ncbi:calcium-binding protein [Seohaeicola zhoushanensis]|uniref:Calcium-binding protein n=1 Tax=Seohaeicola zhoushanensis TaxID=1569283 RepID=A0A8J3MAC4_9RHOB|nr:calcium-binding protein [Seohaeicola zhoushanensis]GHF68316.1 hypothetical protein GCM10017056_44310 [Seohaeicola zhoushanensis]
MAVISLYSGMNAFTYSDLYALNVDNARITTTSATLLAGYVDGFYVSIPGRYYYDAYGLTSGTVYGMTVSYGSTTLASISGLSIDAETMAYMDPSQLERIMLAGADKVTSYWNTGDTYYLYGGDDWVRLGNGNDFVDGGTGVDTMRLEVNQASAKFNMIFSNRFEVVSAQGRDTLSNVEVIEFNDWKIGLHGGNSAGNTISGDTYAGVIRDIIFGAGGNDTLRGLEGDDWLYGQGGDDKLFGDRARDWLFGGGGNDQLEGGYGDDRLKGGGGRDLLLGNQGNDVLFGDKGNDLLAGGAGNDVLTGGAGRDVFWFQKNQGDNVIRDFELGLDHIEIGRGASRLRGLDFVQKGGDVLVSFEGTDILVKNMQVADLQNADNFLF